MGSAFKSIGNFVSGIAKTAAPLASLVPGIGGVLGSIIGSTGAQQHAQGGADAATGALQNIGNTQTDIFKNYAGSTLPGVQQVAGFNKDGTYNEGYNPYATGAQDIYGSSADIQNRANALYDPNKQTGAIVAAREATDPGYDNTVSSIQADSLGRGFDQGNTGTDGQVASTRRAQEAGNNAFARDTYTANANNATAYEANQEAARQGLLTSGLGAKTNELNTLASLGANSAQGATGTMGGLQGFYQGQANNIAQGQGAAAANSGGMNLDLGSALGLNKLLGRKKQSGSLGTTGAQSPSPLPAYNTPKFNPSPTNSQVGYA